MEEELLRCLQYRALEQERGMNRAKLPRDLRARCQHYRDDLEHLENLYSLALDLATLRPLHVLNSILTDGFTSATSGFQLASRLQPPPTPSSSLHKISFLKDAAIFTSRFILPLRYLSSAEVWPWPAWCMVRRAGRQRPGGRGGRQCNTAGHRRAVGNKQIKSKK